MKNSLLTATWLLSAMALTAAPATQTKPDSPAAPPDAFTQAINLLNAGQYQSADAVFKAIGQTDPQYAAAQGYHALCLFQQKDKAGFLKVLATPEVPTANLPPAVREDLDFKQLDALFYGRRLEDLAPKIQHFRQQHGHSTNLTVVAEYQLAGAFERGMKKTYEACISKNTNAINEARWAVGRTNLLEFVALASAFDKTNYQALTNRVLQEEVWQVRMTLGEEEALWQEIPETATADRERLGFVGVKLYQKLQPAEIDQNLARMTRFVRQFPESKNRKRVEFDQASISFTRVESLTKAADAAEQAGDGQTAARKRAEAHAYFNHTLALQDRLAADPAAGITTADVLDRQDDLLYGHYLEQNHGQVLALATDLVQHSAPGELAWMMGKNYRGIVLMAGSTPALSPAAAEFDAVLAQGFTGRAGDDAKVGQLVQWVQASACVKNQQAEFLKTYASVLAPQNHNAK